MYFKQGRKVFSFLGKNKFHWMLLTTIFLFISLPLFSQSQEKIINIRVDTEVVINENFYGFGAETLPWLCTKENKAVGVTEEDIKLNLERIRSMHLPFTRIFVPWETWNPSIDYKTFTWESDEMKSLYRMLDLYQGMGTEVIVVTVDWLKNPPWRNVKASAYAVTQLLKYLVKDRGYSCIRYWTLTNEPELTYEWEQSKKIPFKNYVNIHRLVKKKLKKKRLPIKIIASDEVACLRWFKKSVRLLYNTADVFSSHIYPYPYQIPSVSDFFMERRDIIKKTSLSPRYIPFFLGEFGFRGSQFGACVNSLIDDYEYGLYAADLCIKALKSGVDAASIWCLHQIRLIDEINPEGGQMMRIGLWAFKDEDWQPFPIFYLYQLFTRYIKSGSKVLKTEVIPAGILEAACTQYRNGYSLFILNNTDKEQSFLISPQDLSPEFKKYLYSPSELSLVNGNSLKLEIIKIKDCLKDKIPPKSVALYTNLKE